MIHVETSTHIDRPVEEVFAYIDDLSHLPEWIDIIDDSVASESTTRIGTRCSCSPTTASTSFCPRKSSRISSSRPSRCLVHRDIG